jgi:hypothetical protein
LPTDFLTDPSPLSVEVTEDPGGPPRIIAYTPSMDNKTGFNTRLRPLFAALLILLAALGYATWYVLTAVSVRLEIEPPPDRLAIEGAPALLELGGRYLLRPGTYTIIAAKTGYHPGRKRIEVTGRENQTFSLRLEKRRELHEP